MRNNHLEKAVKITKAAIMKEVLEERHRQKIVTHHKMWAELKAKVRALTFMEYCRKRETGSSLSLVVGCGRSVFSSLSTLRLSLSLALSERRLKSAKTT